MARTSKGRYVQKMVGVSSETFEELDALRQKHESWEKFFKRIYPELKKVSL